MWVKVVHFGIRIHPIAWWYSRKFKVKGTSRRWKLVLTGDRNCIILIKYIVTLKSIGIELTREYANSTVCKSKDSKRTSCHFVCFAICATGNWRGTKPKKNDDYTGNDEPSLAITTIFETRAHSSKNSSTQVLTFSERKETTASVVSYMIRFEGRMTALLLAVFPIGCWTYLSLTQVTTYNWWFYVNVLRERIDFFLPEPSHLTTNLMVWLECLALLLQPQELLRECV